MPSGTTPDQAPNDSPRAPDATAPSTTSTDPISRPPQRFATMPYRTSLEEIARNLWWSWNPQASSIFQQIAPELWSPLHHNPLAILRRVSDARLRLAFSDAALRRRLEDALGQLRTYLRADDTWTARHGLALHGHRIAYLCAEFGLHESLPLYSGGLGVLAGDHIKTASDLGLPLVAIGLRYPEGYFRQHINAGGWQEESYPPIPWDDVPATLVERDGQPLRVDIPYRDRHIHAHIWHLAIGRVPLYLLDTDVPGNNADDRSIGGRLYSGDNTTRIRQEIILGIGAVRALRALDIDADIHHLNEGHCAFAALELIRERMDGGQSWEEATLAVRDELLFTTHTPVPAGHDRFPGDLVRTHLTATLDAIPVPEKDLLALGRVDPDDDDEPFCMTVLGLKLASATNGVSRLHGHVTRTMWKDLWPERAVDDVPVGHVTNGIHVETFMHPRLRTLLDDRWPREWQNALLEPYRWARIVEDIPVDELLELKRAMRNDLFHYLRHRAAVEGGVHGLTLGDTHDDHGGDVLTIGFARRFATYKRGAMLFWDRERAVRLFGDADRPMRIIFAGKAHPKDREGKELIQRIINITRDPAFAGRVIFVENYDLAVARALVSGVDVWLNTPRRPREASGTSGQKVNMHAGINASILDGWWVEGHDGTNGFAIGDEEEPEAAEVQDRRDVEALMTVFEQHILPEFHAGDTPGTGEAWVNRMRSSMSTLPPRFSSRRMVADYAQKYYAHLGRGR
ncbi:MAG: alpha-glucan family phosphorylase [Deltaproteobacteria bacterium]|nr:MAG: alpha-glucan family phosphorylase [Deltaproteobacteria bacterium]